LPVRSPFSPERAAGGITTLFESDELWPDAGAVFIGGAGSGPVVPDVLFCAATSDGPIATIAAASAIRVNMDASFDSRGTNEVPARIVPPAALFPLLGGLCPPSRFEKVAPI
jgi:hypothetical protein